MPYRITLEEFINNTYTPTRKALIEGTLDLLRKLSRTNDLIVNLEEMFSTLDEYVDASVIKDNISQMVINHVIDEVISADHGVIINKDTASLSFIHGILSFYYNMNIFNPITTLEVYNVLTTTELEVEHKLGTLANIYQPDFYTLDVYDMTTAVPAATIDSYIETIERTIDNAEPDPEAIKELFTTVANTDEALLNTKLFNYVMTNSAYHLTDIQILAYIESVISTKDLSSEALAKELTVFALLTKKSTEFMVELVDTTYEEFNTDTVVEYISSKLQTE